MSPKRTHREHRNQLSDNTLVKSKGVKTGTNVNSSGRKNLRKRKKNIEFKDREEPAQKQKNLTMKLRIVPNDDNSMTNIKKMNLHRSIDDSCYLNSGSKDTKDFDKFANSSGANLYSNKTPKKLKSLKQWSGKTRMNSYSPKSLRGSPIVKNLAPYKCNKTPKKSPGCMSPVKAHTIRSSRVLHRTPKRLTLTVNSLSEFQENKQLPNDNNMQLKLHVSDTDLNTSCNLSKRRTSTFPMKKSNKSTSMPSIGVKYGTRRFSKSAKAVLRSTKLKLRSKNSKASTVQYFPYENTKLKEPIVLLQRLPNIVRIVPSSSPLSSSMVKICINDRFSDNNINVSRKIFESAFNRSEEVLEKSDDKRRIRTESYSNDEQKKRLGTTLCKLQETTKTHLHEKSLCDKMTTKCDNASQIFSDSLMSSTPKDKETLNKSMDKCKRRKMLPQCDTSFKLIKRSTRSNQNNVTVTIENEQEEIKGKNETYELIEPKTPNLRKQLQEERNVKENHLNEKPPENNVKVCFTSSDTNFNSNIRSCWRLNEKKKLDDLESTISKASLKKNILKSTIGASHSRSIRGKHTRVVDSITPSQIASKSATSFVDANTPAISPFVPCKNTKSSSTTKKVPNFAEIHKKMFAKLESIVDVKNRVRNRHAAFATPTIDNSAKGKVNSNEGGDQLSKELNRETYNRFGFKMRKREATDCILRNNSLHSARRKQQGRAILKGVRTNRRFELQMKLRNINL
ncbi:hypothetical protein ANTPLA_LOCUS6057 [Anthophora plagiata]